MIKYLGSKRLLIPAISDVAKIINPKDALDMFTGTTRVAQAFKKLGIKTYANDIATYSKVLSECYICTDKQDVDLKEVSSIIEDLMHSKPEAGYITETFCENARYFRPENGAKIDAIRERIAKEYASSPYEPILLTSLMEAADRIDSTTGVQMAYLKKWAARAYNPLEMRMPQLLDGTGVSYLKDANILAQELKNSGHKFELAYFDPPYNQHRYFGNYHIWETLVRWDKPETYGIAQKRIDAKSDTTKSAYNRKNEMPLAFAELISDCPAENMVISYNNESWLSAEQISGYLEQKYQSGCTLTFDYKRYVGAQIGIHNLSGEKVGNVSHTRNKEYIFVAGNIEQIKQVKQHFDA